MVAGPSEAVVETLRQQITELRPQRVVCVGDAVSRLFSQHKLRSDVRIIDNVEMRQKLKPVRLDDSKRIFFAKNRAGTIDMSGWQAVSEAIEAGNAIVVVDGEEDLLALTAMALAPMGSVVIYGQPKAGIVLVVVNKKVRDEVYSMINSMPKG